MQEDVQSNVEADADPNIREPGDRRGTPPEDPYRRNLFATTTAWLGLVLAGASLLEPPNNDGRLREAHWKMLEQIRNVEKQLQPGANLGRVLSEGTPLEIWRTFFSPDARVSQFDIARTLFDPSNPKVFRRYPSMLIGIRRGPPATGRSEGPRGLFIVTRDNAQPDPRLDFLPGSEAWGNGILLAADTENFVFLTNAHVAGPFAEVADDVSINVHPGGLDLAVMIIPRRVIEVFGGDGQDLTGYKVHRDDRDLHGRFAVAAAIDPDHSAKGGIKYFGGFLVSERHSAELLRAIGAESEHNRHGAGYFLLGVPSVQLYLLGSTVKTPETQRMGGVLLQKPSSFIQGSSGSPVILLQPNGLLVREGGITVVGLVSGFFPAQDTHGAPDQYRCCTGLLYVAPLST